MPLVYFDSRAFVKLLVEEDGSELAAALWDGCDAVHLASLLAVGAADLLFAVWDRNLRAGAQAAAVQVVPAE